MLRGLFPLLLVLPILAADNPEPKGKTPPKPRQIKMEGLPTSEGVFGKPAKIASPKELEKTIADKGVRQKIAKQVDFKKEYLLLFRWAGSGGDRVSVTVDKGKKGDVARFEYKSGLTRDLRRHAILYAVPKGMDHNLGK
jgi:hypothetical protein